MNLEITDWFNQTIKPSIVRTVVNHINMIDAIDADYTLGISGEMGDNELEIRREYLLPSKIK